MNAEIVNCRRCQKPLNGDHFALLLENGLPEREELRICPKCRESFARWFGKYGKAVQDDAAKNDPENRSEKLAAFGKNKTKRRHRHQKKQLHPVIRNMLVAIVTIALFVLAFYWTWIILIRASRPSSE